MELYYVGVSQNQGRIYNFVSLGTQQNGAPKIHCCPQKCDAGAIAPRPPKYATAQNQNFGLQEP